ncbi:hypothetical protein [Arthrobacter roseus]|uniref:hypothetical protein n=1 Tax=Arthrobacter roseus TaxID=136274 RepID=UPI0019659F71|nr:hypothetical protein [Arthrobacter roseus]MBM7847509.1 hypothetical protein [Arthrobacter roseus]
MSTEKEVQQLISSMQPFGSLDGMAKAILDENVIIPIRDLGRVTYDPTSVSDAWATHENCGVITESAPSVTDENDAWIMARHWIAIALRLNHERSIDEARLSKSRDAVAARIGRAAYGENTPPTGYDALSRSMQVAIDLIRKCDDRTGDLSTTP